ncbi:MAG: UDP-4-amino-4,6-dideoxy-N-acetyl-beta-L-altrosamine transaminase [Betaproteobacteria bacterium]|nr:UDP-4-amino-4,6-dideoxy-N-acetyl-beta-L-altrosamine transaminase [Betaproteobacteria bacterium]
MIPYGRQEITTADIDAVVAVLRSNYLTQGPAVPQFEQAVASYCGAAHGVAANSATSALHLACLALGVGEGDRVWTSPISFVASANCARYCGAIVDFVDIDARTGNMSVDRLAVKLREARVAGSLPKVVIPVHLCGLPCDIAAIHALGQEYGFRIIEDASHAIGARYRGQQIGNCRYSDIAVFSFHPVKIITTGEGGMAMTNDAEIANRMALLRSHGITRDPSLMSRVPDGPWYYQQIDLGYNYRMTDIQAALGISQLERLEGYVSQRQELARRYDQLLADLPLLLPYRDDVGRSSIHLYVVRLLLDRIQVSHRTVFDELRGNGIGVNLHYIPIYSQPYYQRLEHAREALPEADAYYAAALSLPLFPALSEDDQRSVADTLRAALGW